MFCMLESIGIPTVEDGFVRYTFLNLNEVQDQALITFARRLSSELSGQVVICYIKGVRYEEAYLQ